MRVSKVVQVCGMIMNSVCLCLLVGIGRGCTELLLYLIVVIVVANSTEEARDILSNLFDQVSKDEIETMRYMLIEVCVCVFHGFSSVSTDKNTEPASVELIPQHLISKENFVRFL